MAELVRGYSFIMYEYAPSLTYGIPFPYLDQRHVRVFAGEPGDAVEVPLTWVTSATIAIPAATPDGVPIPANAPITIRRFTPRDRALVTYQDGAQLPAADLNLATQQLLYIVQESIDFGSYGGAGLPGGGTGWADGNTPPDPQIQEIIDRILQSDVFKQVVLTPIADIDTNAQVILEEILRSQDYFDEYRKQGDNIAKAFDSIAIVQTEQQASVEKIDGIYTRLGDAEAGIVTVQQAVSDETYARATQINQVVADFNTANTAANARIDTVEQATADETAARAAAITQVRSEFQTADAATNAAVQAIADTYATKDQATAIAETKVDALANGAVAHIEERFEAMAAGSADPDGKFSAVWSVRMVGSVDGGKPVVAGVGLGIDPQTGSSFIVSADQFAIVHPNYTAGGALASVKFPFVVGQVGGVTNVGIDGNLVVDKTIKANHLSVNSLSAITGNLGTVNGGRFRTHTLDANGNIINPNEFRVDITNDVNDTWPLWIGSGVKNANNAVFWVDRDGNAMFKGKVSALNMIDQLQQHGFLNITTAFSIGNSSDPCVLPAPLQPGQTHQPVIMVSGEMFNSHSSEWAGCAVALQKLSGGTWVDLRVVRRGIRNLVYENCDMMVFDTPTTVQQQYRLQLRDTGFQSGSMSIQPNSTIYAFGLR